MAQAPDRVVALSCCAGLLAACTGSRPVEYVYESPVELAELLVLPRVLDPRAECEFQALVDGMPAANALLRVEWPEAGRLVFQMDAEGRLTMRFGNDMNSKGVVLSVDQKQPGQDLLAAPYDQATTRLENAQIRVRVIDFAEGQS